MPIKVVRTKPVSNAVPVPGSTTLEFTAASTGGEDVNAVVLYSVMDGAAVRISGGGQAAPTIGASNTRVAQLVDFDRTENPTPMSFRVRAAVTENGVEQAEQVWTIRVDSTAMAEAILESGGTLEPEGTTGRKRATKRKSASKKGATKKKAAGRKGAAKKTTAKKAAAKKSATKKKSVTKKSATKKSTARKSAAKKSATRKSSAKKSSAKKSSAQKSSGRGGATKRAAAKRRGR